MKKEVKDLWVKALRSGKYKQTTKTLKNNEDDAYCCLGVLCDISKQGEWGTHGTHPLYMCGDNLNDFGELPSAVMYYAGISHSQGLVEFPKGTFVSLINLNDTRRRSFKQIAAFIERNWEKL